MDTFRRRLIRWLALAALLFAHSAGAQTFASVYANCVIERDAGNANTQYTGETWSCIPDATHSPNYMELRRVYGTTVLGHSHYQYVACTAPAEPSYTTGQCESPASTSEDCQALSEDELYNGAVPRTYSYPASGSATSCNGGCAFGPRAGFGQVTSTAFGTKMTTAMFGFSGELCTSTTPQPPVSAMSVAAAPPQVCVPAGSGQTYCVKSDGRQCYTVSGTTRQICWSGTETGVKRDGTIAQVRNNSTSTPPAPTIPGETPTAAGTPMPSTTTSGTTTINNNVQNYTTTSTAPANQGEASAGDSASGGSCGSAYMCSGDTLKCAMLEEARKTRCAVEHGNEGITGGATCAPGDVPACTGATCNASAYSLVLQQHKTRCAAEALGAQSSVTNTKLGEIKTAIEGIQAGTGTTELAGQVGTPGDDDAAQGEGGTAVGNGHGAETQYGQDGLDEAGMGFDRSCPTLSFDFNGAHYQPDMFWICTGAEIESYIFLLIVAVLCLRYIGGP